MLMCESDVPGDSLTLGFEWTVHPSRISVYYLVYLKQLAAILKIACANTIRNNKVANANCQC